MTHPVKVEVQVDDVWLDVTCRTRRRSGVDIRRGRTDEAGPVQPAQASMTIDNTDGAFTPGLVTSPHWPHIRRGLPVRVSLDDPTLSALRIDGHPQNTASTPNHASLGITGDLTVMVEGRIEWDGGHGTVLAGRYTTTGNQRSWLLTVEQRRLHLYWSTDGTLANRVLLASPMLPWSGLAHRAVRVELDVDDSGSHRATFWTAAGLAGPWVLLGDAAGAGTTSVHAGTSPMGIGSAQGTSAGLAGFACAGDIYSGRLYNGRHSVGGATLVADPDFTTEPAGTTSFDDSVGRTWSVNGSAQIVDRRIRFSGRADSFQVDWPVSTGRDDPYAGVAEVTVHASGLVHRMAQGQKPLDSTLRRLVTSPLVAPDVVAYWPFEDGRDSDRFASPIAGVAPMVHAGFDLASDDSLAASAPLPRASGDGFAFRGIVPPSGGSNWRVDWFTYAETAPSSALWRVMWVGTAGTARRWLVAMSATDILLFIVDGDGALIGGGAFPLDPRFFGTWMLWSLSAVRVGAGQTDWALNVVPIPLGAAFGTSGSISVSEPILGRPSWVGAFSPTPDDGVSYGHVIVSRNLGIGWLAGADTAWVGETAAHRFWRLCSEESIARRVVGDPTVDQSGIRGDPTFSELMGPQRQLPLLELLAEAADVDGGVLFEDRAVDGLVLRTRQSFYNQAPAVSLDAGDKALTRQFVPVLDDQRLVNDVTATRPDGSSARIVDDESVTVEGLYDVAVDVNVEVDEQLVQQAAWRVHRGTWLESRVREFGTSMTSATSAVRAAWNDAEIGDLVELDGLPRQVQVSTRQHIEGYREFCDLVTRRLEPVNTSPAGPWQVGVLDGDGTPDTDLARLDAEGSVLQNSISDTSTSMTVADAFGGVWTADPDYYPLRLTVGGEVIEASGADSNGGLHRFTGLTRGANGVVKSHPFGTPVHVADPFRLSM